jgi:hypothetical protein
MPPVCHQIETARKRGAGYFLPRVWECPPALKIPQDWGYRGLIETISAFSYYTSISFVLYILTRIRACGNIIMCNRTLTIG